MEDFPSFVETESATGGNTLTYHLLEGEVKRIKDSAINQALETIRNRIDQFGVAEPLIQRQGLKQIVVQLPGIKEPKRAKDLIKETALLEFKLLDESARLSIDLPNRIPKTQEEEVLKKFEGRIPEGDQILFEKFTEKDSGREYRVPYLVKKRVMLAGDVLSDARVSIGQFNEPYVSVTFDAKGAREFDRITAENVKKRMAIVLDNTIYSAPVIQERISGGRAQISGTFTMQEANDLAIVLRAGALPAPLTVVEERTVGPGLGQDSIEKGELAAYVGSIMVVVFMLVTYRLFGVFANVAVAINVAMIFGLLSLLNATLTLPGIAGIVLTVGIAVDSNVLIYERIREELRHGRNAISAIDAGFRRALATILDSNITTFIAAAVLFYIGTGPVRGFAVTLGIGIITTVFTAFTLTSLIVAGWVRWKRPKTVPI
jgi:preprotein translocase subunit SecD